MKLRNKIISIVLVLVLMLGLTSCGTQTGEVSYGNYDSIVTVSDAEEGTDPSSYNDVIILLGAPTNSTAYADGNGTIEWQTEDGEIVIVTFVDSQVTEKSSENLYDTVYTTPIGEKTGAWEWVILQLGTFTFHASNLFGLLGSSYLYWLGLLIMTLLVRTLGWPIYARTNDMTMKMQLAQPELNKVQEKYRNRQDQASQQRMQMETMDIYKKYKINLLGCFMPLLQMPIFIAMYQVVQRFPLTDLSVFTSDTSIIMNTNFLWTTLGNTDWLPNLPLAILVSGLMFLSQWLTQKRSKAAQGHVKYQSAQQQQSQNTMKYMMYFMVIFMGYISLRSAGIAWYWIIGNTYQIGQSYVSYKNMEKQREKLRRQF